MTTKIFTIAHVPDDLAQAWLQHLRDFDTAHPDCHFEAFSEAPDASMADLVKMLKIEPGLTITEYFARKRKGDF